MKGWRRADGELCRQAVQPQCYCNMLKHGLPELPTPYFYKLKNSNTKSHCKAESWELKFQLKSTFLVLPLLKIMKELRAY